MRDDQPPSRQTGATQGQSSLDEAFREATGETEQPVAPASKPGHKRASPQEKPLPQQCQHKRLHVQTSSSSTNIDPELLPDELKSEKYRPSELLEIRAAAAVGRQMGVRKQNRGPPGLQGDVWRGQKYRKGSGRCATRGGVLSEWCTCMYTPKRRGHAFLQQWLIDNPKPPKQ